MVKLVVAEDGSELVAELWDAPLPVAASLLAYPEGRAALAAARRAGRLTPAGHRNAVEDLDATWAELLVVGIDEELARRAGELADEFGLRGYDAVHLASALALGPATTFTTWDVDLSAAAHESGLAVAPPT
jgi:predicted nucleic acid-binding protein